MKTNFLVAMAMIGLGLIGTSALQAQSSSSAATPVSVTGCLAQGATANDFSIRDESGKSYDLMASSGVNLKPHLGHKVTITGTPTKETTTGEKANTKTGTAGAAEHLQVSNVKMVSTTCP